ncbi:MAG TPA: asparagine synthetase B [Bacteroidia bacterium]|jgi:hypothetical protein|nr:asparagine synthetase B [Bacteroidia bacterium]
MKKFLSIFLLCVMIVPLKATYLLIPMDDAQKDHLKSYGLVYWVLEQGGEAQWLLNYRYGSFLITYDKAFELECNTRGVSYETLPDAQANDILTQISSPEVNMDAVKLEKPPKIAVYSPPDKQPWDDAVTLVLTYAEIPYHIVYDEKVLNDSLATYDWIHLHHEDFTGQYGRFYAGFSTQPWYRQQVATDEGLASKLGYKKVSEMKLAVVKKIRDFVAGGGFMFAMCSATDSYDIALAAEGVDICDRMYDGDGMDLDMNSKLNYANCFAFQNFKLKTNSTEYEFSDIDTYETRMQKGVTETNDYFTLFEFSAKWDPVPTMLCQDHANLIKGFWGQTTGFDEALIKPGVLIMGENKAINEARYIHGDYGKGMWTFYSGHDPEDYQHRVEEPPTDLSLYPNSAGYRLILNNVLFPAAKKKHQKT